MAMHRKKATETSWTRLTEAGADEREVHDAAAAGARCYTANFVLGCEGRASAIDSKGYKVEVDVLEREGQHARGNKHISHIQA